MNIFHASLSFIVGLCVGSLVGGVAVLVYGLFLLIGDDTTEDIENG